MINVNAKRVEDGFDVNCEISGKGCCIFNELRTLFEECLKDADIAHILVCAMSAAYEDTKHD